MKIQRNRVRSNARKTERRCIYSKHRMRRSEHRHSKHRQSEHRHSEHRHSEHRHSEHRHSSWDPKLSPIFTDISVHDCTNMVKRRILHIAWAAWSAIESNATNLIIGK